MQSTQNQTIFNKLFNFRNHNNSEATSETLVSSEVSEDFKQIQAVIEKDVKPYIKSHGGKITLLKVEDNRIHIHLDGACKNCPAIQLTMKGFVERLLKDKFPEIKEVILEKIK
ncbi:MAG: NifU family protein [Chloroherpetonaceae bacterium]|nr:NifU family protein [bacterium]